MGKVIAKLFAIFVLSWALAACSFQVEVGYHGKTGRDDRKQSTLVNGAKHF